MYIRTFYISDIRTKEVSKCTVNEAILKLRLSISFQLPSVGIRLLRLSCSWWHSRQANDAVASERSIISPLLKIFSENHGFKSFACCREPVRVPIFRGLV